MGKPTTTKKTTTTAKKAAAKVAPEPPAIIEAPVPAPAPVPEVVAKPKRVRAAKPAAEKPAAEKLVTEKPVAEKPAKKAAAPKAPRKKAVAMAKTFTAEDIGLRAYFIAEKRQQTGQWGTPEGDWLEAERQLRAESAS
jgi:hypothetical protein